MIHSVSKNNAGLDLAKTGFKGKIKSTNAQYLTCVNIYSKLGCKVELRSSDGEQSLVANTQKLCSKMMHAGAAAVGSAGKLDWQGRWSRGAHGDNGQLGPQPDLSCPKWPHPACGGQDGTRMTTPLPPPAPVGQEGAEEGCYT